MLRLVVMGVSGCGKTTLGAALAARLGVAFVDADDLHPPANRAKMAAGVALTDADRWPWLDLVAEALHNRAPVVEGGIAALDDVEATDAPGDVLPSTPAPARAAPRFNAPTAPAPLS